MAVVQRAFVDFLKSVDLPKVRDEEFCLKAANAFQKNEVMQSIGSCCRPCLQFVVPSDVRYGRHHGV